MSRRQVYVGSFVHSKTEQELETLHNAALAVDEQGKIKAITKGDTVKAALDSLLQETGWSSEDVEVTQTEEGQFFFPGFIGKSHSRQSRRWLRKQA